MTSLISPIIDPVLDATRRRRAARALVRQLEYQRSKAERIDNDDDAHQWAKQAANRTLSLKSRLNCFRTHKETDKVLEVGSGAHGHIFFWDNRNAIGIDPLADHYRELFPVWQSRTETLAAYGEHLPFRNKSFDLVISDNVVDHALDPRRIVQEMVRVLAPGGLLYFTVHVHHRLYAFASKLQLAACALRLPLEIGPFADHTVHLGIREARHLFNNLPLEQLEQTTDIEATLSEARATPPRHLGDRLKSVFYKNATFELIARRLD